MGCFFGCFVSSKDKKCRKLRYRVIPRDHQKPRIQDILMRADESLELIIKETPSNPIRESREKTEVVPPLRLKRRKKVTFDTNVITYEHVQVYDSTESLLERNEKGETFPKSKDEEEDSLVLSTSNYRYGNCVESDDEFEDFDHQEEEEDYDFDEDYYDLDDDDDDDVYDEVEDDGVLDPSMELNRNARDENGYVLSVLNPVENLDQWKALKSKGSTRKLLNVNGLKENAAELENQNQETGVVSSLSIWVVSSDENMRNYKKVECC